MTIHIWNSWCPWMVMQVLAEFLGVVPLVPNAEAAPPTGVHSMAVHYLPWGEQETISLRFHLLLEALLITSSAPRMIPLVMNCVNQLVTKSWYWCPWIVTGSAHTQGKGILKDMYSKEYTSCPSAYYSLWPRVQCNIFRRRPSLDPHLAQIFRPDSCWLLRNYIQSRKAMVFTVAVDCWLSALGTPDWLISYAAIKSKIFTWSKVWGHELKVEKSVCQVYS